MISRVRRFPSVGLAAVCAIASAAIGLAACGDDGAAAPLPAPDAEADAPQPESDAGPAGPVFLDPSEYASLVTIDATFPFGVTRKVQALFAYGAYGWGNHGGPLAGFPDMTETGELLEYHVHRWSFPDGNVGAATLVSTTLPTDLPHVPFGGLVDLPFGGSSIISGYDPSTYVGQAWLLSSDTLAVKATAHVNGMNAVVGMSDGSRNVLVYTAFGPMTDTASAVEPGSSFGVFVNDACGDVLVGSECAPAVKVAHLDRATPLAIASDAHGNVFVSGNAIYGLSKRAVFGRQTLLALALNNLPDPPPTMNIAAVAPDGDKRGWVVGLTYVSVGESTQEQLVAESYREEDGELVGGNERILAAVMPVGDNLASPFSDRDGHLWVAVASTSPYATTFLKLERKAP